MSELWVVEIERGDSSIELSEWVEIVREHEDLTLIDSIPGRNPMTGEAVQVKAHGAAKWSAHPDGIEFIFAIQRGRIRVASGDEFVVEKARALATDLDAEVRVSSD